MSTLYIIYSKTENVDITLKSRMKICTKREDGFIFEEY